MPQQSKSGQIGFAATLGMWLALTLAGALYAGWQGYGGRSLAAACVIAFAVLFAGELLPAARGVTETVRRALPAPIGWLLAAPILLAWFVYALNTGSLTAWNVAIACAYVLAPLALLSLAKGATGGVLDYAVILALALPVKLLLLRPLWPYPNGRLAYTFTMLLSMNVGVAGFLFVRQLEGVGYSIGWGKDWAFFIGVSFLAVAAVDIPAGRMLGFLYWAPGHAGWTSLPLSALTIFFFTAWPEEFLFRGLLQNLLSRSMKSEGAGWACASVIFGLSHIRNGGFWNWKYALLATFAGFCYGWTWRKTGSIFGSAIVHCAVDTAWHALFR